MSSRRPLVALVLLTFIWGYNWVLNKQALAYAPPFMFAALRCAAGTVAMFIVLLLLRRSLKPVAPVKTFWFGFFNTAAFLLCQTWALVEGGVGKSAVLAFTMPIWTLFLAWVVLGERIRGAQWLAAIGALVGLVLIVAPWSSSASLVSKALGIGSAISWSIATIMLKRWRGELATDLLNVIAWHFVYASIVLILVALVVTEPPVLWAPRFIGILFFISVIATALAWSLWLYVLQSLPTWQASLAVLGVPVLATLGSRLQLGERIDPSELAGMILIGVGLALLSILNWRKQRIARGSAGQPTTYSASSIEKV